MKRSTGFKQFVSLMIFALVLTSHAAETKQVPKKMGISDYLLISCENLIKKETQDQFLNQLKNKLAKIHKANGSHLALNTICEDLGEAQFSRLMEDEHLLYEKK